jgi:hypothetical protein
MSAAPDSMSGAGWGDWVGAELTLNKLLDNDGETERHKNWLSVVPFVKVTNQTTFHRHARWLPNGSCCQFIKCAEGDTLSE